MTHLAIPTTRTGGPRLRADGALRIVAAAAACHRWARAMEARHDRLGAGGFQPGAEGLDALLASLDADAGEGRS